MPLSNRTGRVRITPLRTVGCVAALLFSVAIVPGCERRGDAATPRTVEFVVEGMHCDGCAETISHTLGEVAGVTACRVDHDGGTASIDVLTTDPQIEARLAEAIAGLGFVVRRPTESPAAPVTSN